MKILGFWLLIVGAAIAAGSLLMPTTAPVEVPSGTLYGLPTRSDVYNLGLLRDQSFVFIAGCALTVLGGILAAIGHLGEQLLRPAEKTDTPAQLAHPSPTSATPSDAPTSVDSATDEPNSEIGWIIGVGAVALLIAFFAIVFGQLSSNSSAPAANITDMNVTDEIVDNMTPTDAGALATPIATPSPKATEALEVTPTEDDSEIGRDNWEGD